MAKVRSKVEVPPHLRLGLNCRAYIEFIDFELIKVGFMKNCTQQVQGWVSRHGHIATTHDSSRLQ